MYNALKTELEEIAGSRPQAKSPSWGSPLSPLLPKQASFGLEPENWRGKVQKDAERVGDFVDRGIDGLEEQLQELSCYSPSARGNSVNACPLGVEGESEGDKDLQLRILEAVGAVSEGTSRLRSFAELNHAALYKILKKHDKLLGTKDGLGVEFPKLVKTTGLANMGRFDNLDAKVKELSNRNQQTDGLGEDVSSEVARLAAGLGRNRAASARSEPLLYFFLGTMSTFLVCVVLLLSLPAGSLRTKHTHTFSTAYFLAPIPVFRVVFSVVLSLWCLGLIARACYMYDVNHLFILNIDPRCRVTPNWFFTRAALLTTLEILLFGTYVVDYKWAIGPRIWASYGLNMRSSAHFVLYPVALIIITISSLLYPSRLCIGRYKWSIVYSIGRTAAAPFYHVSFFDNIIGDALTSLAKPLQDVPAAVCYLASSHPQTEESVARFAEKGDLCPGNVHLVALPVIAGLPYWFRAFQCLSRWLETRRETPEPKHLWNFGKYCASLLVVVISAVPGMPLSVVVIFSIAATTYASVWDIQCDWGLRTQDLVSSRLVKIFGCDKAGDPGIKKVVRWLHFQRTVVVEKGERPRRHFKKRVYVIASLLDIAARCSWVLTLVPITIIAENIALKCAFVTLISSLEVVRRSAWAVLRMEHEQIANASGFRALLWTPSLFSATVIRAKSRAKGADLTTAQMQ